MRASRRFVFALTLTALIGAAASGDAREPSAAPPEPDYSIVSSGPDEVSVVMYRVTAFGAVADDGKDDSAAFQRALDAAAARGGVVFAPAGVYRFDAPLVIPTTVTLRGEWSRPDPAVKGTILAVYCGRGDSDGPPFVTLEYCSGIKRLSIWYPEQDPRAITAYPVTIKQRGGDNATAMNLALVNAYAGLQVGPENNELHYFKDIHATALKTGMRIDLTSDIGRFENLYFNPSVWRNSGLPGAPVNGEHEAWMRENGTGFLFLRSDWPYLFNLNISGYHTGIRVRKGDTLTLANGQFYGSSITDCSIALDAHELSSWGMTLTRCTLVGSRYGIRLNPAYNGMLGLNTCTVDGGEAALLSAGNGYISFHQCRIGNTLEVDKGAINVVDCDFSFGGRHINFSNIIESAVLLGNRFKGEPGIANASGSGRILIDHSPQDLRKLPELVYRPQDYRKTAERRNLYVVSDPEWGIRADDGRDISAQLQFVLDSAAENGGGIVYLPGGRYLLDGQIVVPGGVELRGVYEVPHHSMGDGSVLVVTNRETIPVVLEGGSGLKGLSFQYAEQEFGPFIPYPYLIQGRGPDIYIINVDAANPYRFVDLFTHRCDHHFLDYLSGCPLDVGIRVGGGSRNGLIQNCQFNHHSWSRCWSCPVRPQGGIHHPEGKQVLDQMLRQSRPFVFGDCDDQTVFNNFVYGSHTGIHFIAENGKGASGTVFGHGVDGTQTSVYMEHAEDDLVFINSQLVSYKTEDLKRYIVFTKDMDSSVGFFNTSFWGGPDGLGAISGGELALHQASFKRIFGGSTGPFEVDGGSLRLETVRCDEAIDVLDLSPGARPSLAIGGSYYFPIASTFDAKHVARAVAAANERTKLVAVVNTWRTERLEPGERRIHALGTHPMKFHGLEVVTDSFETRLVPVTRDDRQAWMSVEKVSPERRHVYVDVVYDAFTDGTSGKVRVTVEYFDEGEATVGLVYDSTDPSVEVVKGSPGAWKPAGTIDLDDTRTWKSQAFIIDDARFNNRCNGSDLRLNINPAVDFVLGSVAIEKI